MSTITRTTTLIASGTILALILSACGQRADDQQTAEPAAKETSAAPATSIYEAAVANDARPEADRARDAGRKPAEVLKFLGITPGMTVLDMFSGGGYYTEILSYTVGDSGRVIAQSNEAYLQFVGDEFEERYLGGRLSNAQVLMAENNELKLEAESLDAILLVLSFHDLFYAAPEARVARDRYRRISCRVVQRTQDRWSRRDYRSLCGRGRAERYGRHNAPYRPRYCHRDDGRGGI